MVLKTEMVRYGTKATAPTIDFSTHPTEGYEDYFISWSEPFDFVEEHLTIYLNKGSRLKTFEVLIINGDETTRQYVEWGKNVALPIGYKTSTKQVTYTFVKWDNDGKNIYENRVITAIFETTYNYFEVRFYDGQNDLIKLEKVLPGESANAPATAYKTKEKHYIYIFNGWDKDIDQIEQDLDVYALFTQKDRYYTVVFNDAYGEVLSTQTIEYGLSASAPMIPEKTLPGAYDYEFISWDKDFSVVTEDLIIKPIFEQVLKYFTVNFYDGNNNLIKSEKVGYNLNAIAPNNVTKMPTTTDYFIFDGWDKDFTKVTQDLDVYATFIHVDRWYNIRFIGENDELLTTQVVEYGKDAVDPRPSLAYTIIDEETVYAIIGWDGILTNITSNQDVYAIYESVPRYYTVTFMHDDESIILYLDKVHYGTHLTGPNPPTKAGNEDYFYVFSGWDQDISFITSNLIVKATFDMFKTSYTVTFLDGDGNIFDTQVVAYGEDAMNPGIPFKTPTDEISYVFSKWDLDYTNVTSDLVITPSFTTTVRTFTVIFEDENGNIIKEEQVRRGFNATPPEVPEKPATEYYEFVAKWNKPFNNISEDIIIQLYYETVIRLYTLSFYDDAGNLYYEIMAEYGQVVTQPDGPTKAMTAQFYYEFISWDPSFDGYVYENATYHPVYESHIRHYTVTFLDGNGDVFDEQSIPYGHQVEKPLGIPTKDETQQFYYVFNMWETTTIRVYQDLTINALFHQNLQMYEVIFVDEFGNPIDAPQMVAYGTGAVEPPSNRIPHKPSTQTHEYAFGGWDVSFSYITNDLVVKTIYVGTLRKFTYTFYLDDQTTILKHITGAYGDPIVEPPIPVKEGTESLDYVFVGWHRPVAKTLIQNEVYYAVFEEKLKTFTITYYDGNGHIFESQLADYGSFTVPPISEPTKLPTIMYQYHFIGWDFDFDTQIKSDMKVYPIFEETLRIYTVTFIVNNEIYRTVDVPYGQQAKVPSPNIDGYDFLGWDQGLSTIVRDMTTYAMLRAKSYEIIFDDGYEPNDIMPVEGYMDSLIIDYDEEFSLPASSYVRPGYVFIGWRTLDTNYPILMDEETMRLKDKFEVELLENIVLIATWLAEEYYIDYELNGGYSINPDRFTVEDEIILQSAYKDNHKFVGWYKVDTTPKQKMLFINATSSMEGELVEVIEMGTIGDIKLIAIFEYNGFIQLKDESMLGLYHAEIATTIPILEREVYDDDNPVYLLGVFLGQTIGNLRENFINEALIFVDSQQNILDDNQVVATGYQILVVDDDDQVIDRVHIVLKGDTNGDGRINAQDTAAVTNYINKSNMNLIAARLIAADMNSDGRINAQDAAAVRNHINRSKPIYDETITSTMRMDYQIE